MATCLIDSKNMERFYEMLALEGGHLVGYTHLGADGYLWCWNEADAELFDKYLSQWIENGFRLVAEYTLGENSYKLLEGEKNTVYLSFIPSAGYIRLYSEEKGSSVPPPVECDAFETVDGYTPTLWQLPIDNKGSEKNGGMSYVIQVADGSFFIIDGGYATDTEAGNLYEFLREKAMAVGIDTPVISGWFISHLHSDHYGCFMKFAELYADKTELRAMYFNLPADNYTFQFELGISREEKIIELANNWSGVKIYRRLHTGMKFFICNLQVDVLFTYEDAFPNRLGSQNDTSTVLRLSIAGQRLMFPMDIQKAASQVIEAQISHDELKSDIVEFSHHGYEGATQLFYDIVSAPTILWPMNIYGWQRPDKSNVFERYKEKTKGKSQLMPNAYICEEAPYVKKIIVAGAGLAELKLPYTPEGDKLPDYVAIHDAIAAVEEPEERPEEKTE